MSELGPGQLNNGLQLLALPAVCMCVILVLVYAHVCAACLHVLALVLTQGQRCLSMLSVLTDV